MGGEIDDLFAVVRPDAGVVSDGPHHIVASVIADDARTDPSVHLLTHFRNLAEKGGDRQLANDFVDPRSLCGIGRGLGDCAGFVPDVDHAGVEIGLARQDFLGLVEAFDTRQLAVGKVQLHDRGVDLRRAGRFHCRLFLKCDRLGWIGAKFDPHQDA